jgi:hypothetical protein
VTAAAAAAAVLVALAPRKGKNGKIFNAALSYLLVVALAHALYILSTLSLFLVNLSYL